MADTLQVRLLGEVALSRDGVPLPPLESARAESLLAYLLLHRDAPVPRQQLAFLLWPDSTEAQARTNLRHLLHTLRRALPDADAQLEVTARTLRWRGPAAQDVAAFEEALARAEEHADPAAALREAVAHYRGDLLAGVYDEWVDDPRQRLRALHLDALARLVGLLEQQGELDEAVRHTERLQRADPLSEPAARTLMRLHAARGDAARAVRTYHATAATLDRELGVGPSAETRDAYAALLAASDPPAAAPPASAPAAVPLIGRRTEREALAGAWREAAATGPRLALVTGEPGVGKTRLVEELRAWCARRGAAVAEARCYGAEGALAYAPVVAWLRSDAVRPALARVDPAVRAELAALLPELGPSAPQAASAEDERRRRLFDAVARTLLDCRTPLLLVADDLQWADAPSLQLVHYLLRSTTRTPLLVAATARREELDPDHPAAALLAALAAQDRLTDVALERLDRGATAALATSLRGRALEPGDADALHAETEGNPLFVVEAVRAGWPAAAGGGALSARVQAVIAARLGQLSAEARELAGLAAAAGRAFASELLAAAGAVEGAALVRSLDELWRRGLVVERGADGYDFSHGRIRDVAYGELSPARRRAHHLALAQALAADAPEAASGEIAAHYQRAGAVDEAAAWYERAAAASLRRHAAADAVRLLDLALDAVGTMVPGPRRDRLELDLLTAQLGPLVPLGGYLTDEVDRVRDRAVAVATASGLPPPPPLLRSLALASAGRGDWSGTDRLGLELQRRGDAAADDVLRVEGAYVRGIAALWAGRITESRAHLEDAVAWSREELRAVHLAEYGQDAEIVCRSRLAFVLALQDRFDESRAAAADALALARRVAHPYSTAVAQVFAGHAAMERGDLETVVEVAADLAAQTHHAHNRLTGRAFAGTAEILAGRVEEGLALMHEAYASTGGVDRAPALRAALTRQILWACEHVGDVAGGLAAADRLLGLRDSGRTWDAEALRVRAVLRAARGAPAADVLPDLERAIALAASQGALAFRRKATQDVAALAEERPRNAPAPMVTP